MTKSEIIQTTLAALRDRDACQDILETACCGAADDYEASVVIPTLQKLLPDNIDIKTCVDFPDIGVTCCPVCHDFLPHFEMSLEDLPDGRKAWLCCCVSSALRGDDPEARSNEILDLERALGGASDGALTDN